MGWGIDWRPLKCSRPHYFIRQPLKVGFLHWLQPVSPYLHLEQPNLIFFGGSVSASVVVRAAAGRLKAQPAAAGRCMTAGASSTLLAAIRSSLATASTADGLTAVLAGDLSIILL